MREKEGNTFRVEGVEAAGDMYADLTRARQILLNLLSNADSDIRYGTPRTRRAVTISHVMLILLQCQVHREPP